MPAAAIQPPPFFRPDEATTNALIAALIDPALSLQALAESHNTTTEALSLWMTRSDIRERLDAIDSTIAWRTRLVANSQLSAVVHTCSIILKDFNASHAADSIAAKSVPQSDPSDPTLSLRAACFELRQHELARKTAALLIRLANARPVANPLHARANRESTGAKAPAETAARTPSIDLLSTIQQAHTQANTPKAFKPVEAASESRGASQITSPSIPHQSQPHRQPPSILSVPSFLAEPSTIPTTTRATPPLPLQTSKPRNPRAQQLLAAAAREHWP